VSFLIPVEVRMTRAGFRIKSELIAEFDFFI